jgi:hypothetical protein
MRRKMMWVGKERPQSWAYSFDAEPHFQYFEEYKKRPATREMAKQGYSETMSLQGSFFMSTLENYWRLKLSDEALGNWGNQGIELACKMWLSGGRVLVNHRTWYAHMFRTQGAEFGFPYPQSGHDVQRTKKMVVDDVWGQKLVGQIYPVSWLVQRFWPVPGWSENNLRKLLEFEAAIPNSLSK